MAHTVSDLVDNPTPTGTRTVPKHIEEVHLQIQKRSVNSDRDGHPRVHRRLLSGVGSVVTTVDAAGSSIISTVTAALDGGTQVLVFIFTFALFGGAGKAVEFPPYWGNNFQSGNFDYCMQDPANAM